MGMDVIPSRSTLQGPVTVNGNLQVVGTNPNLRQLQVQQAAGQTVSPFAMLDASGTVVEFALNNATGAVRPGNLTAGTSVTGALYYATGAPSNAAGNDGDMYLRTDGAALTTIYQKRAGAWVGIV